MILQGTAKKKMGIRHLCEAFHSEQTRADNQERYKKLVVISPGVPVAGVMIMTINWHNIME